MKNNFKIFLKAILAGAYIAIASCVYLYVLNIYNDKVLASFLFSIGLLVIVARGYYLYTGKVGYMLPYKDNNLKMILITLLGNFLGIATVSILINASNINEIYLEALKVVNIKFSNSWYITIILSYFCGILMYTAVDGYNNIKDTFSRNIIVILSVMVFLILGFEHSIANIAYIILNKSVSFKQALFILLMIIGNGIGGITINLLHTLNLKEDK